jgi:hypothetical protein
LTGHPDYQPLPCSDKWINTHHENNLLSMEDTDSPVTPWAVQAHKTDVYLKILEMAHANLLGTEG